MELFAKMVIVIIVGGIFIGIPCVMAGAFVIGEIKELFPTKCKICNKKNVEWGRLCAECLKEVKKESKTI